MRVLRSEGADVVGLDLLESEYTAAVGSIVDREFVRSCVQGVDAIVHTATLHKPHVGSHSRQAFVDTNVTGTLNLLEEAVAAECRSLRLHEHDERLRPGALPARRGARSVDHGGRRSDPQERLRRHKDGS